MAGHGVGGSWDTANFGWEMAALGGGWETADSGWETTDSGCVGAGHGAEGAWEMAGQVAGGWEATDFKSADGS